MNKKNNLSLFLLYALAITHYNIAIHAAFPQTLLAQNNDSFVMPQNAVKQSRKERMRNKKASKTTQPQTSITSNADQLPSNSHFIQKAQDRVSIDQNITNQPLIPTITLKPLPLELQVDSLEKNANTESSSMPNTLPLADPQEEKIEFNFEDADLQTVVKHVEELYNITFITEDMIAPLPQGAHSLKGNKLSFKTNKLLSKQDAWDLFITFLSMSGFTIVPDGSPSRFKITTIDDAKKSPLRTFIGVDPATLPNNDELIRYVYFVASKHIDTIYAIIEKLRSTASAPLIKLPSHKAFILTDKAYNIKTLMNIVKEIDKAHIPQSMSVLKLRRADAQEVKNLYDSLIGTNAAATPQQFFQARKQPTSLFFPENTVIIAEPRTNSLILLGTKEAIAQIESFIIKNIDIELDTPYSPLYVYQLKYADAITIAEIMNNITKDFGQTNAASQYGGVRGIDKFMQPISFTPETTTNRLVIKGHYNDYLAAKNIIDKLDEAQPQVAIEVLILSVTLTNQKQLGAQIRSKSSGANGLLGNNVKFQTSGLFQNRPVVLNNRQDFGVTRLLGNLVNLATGAAAGNTIITLGSDAFGVWGIFQALQTAANAQIISNPFLIATNKTPATISVGETRRVQTGVVFSGGSSGIGGGTETFGDEPANLSVEVTPQINSDGMIVLDLNINITNFLNPNQSSATKLTRQINTSTIVANREVLALGGLIRNNVSNSSKKTPVLGNIPILGWLFKNQSKTEDKDNLLILISSRIIEPHHAKEVNRFNTERIDDYHGSLAKMNSKADNRDPIHKLFFAPNQAGTEQVMDDFLLRRGNILEKDSLQTKGKLALRKEKKLRKKNMLNNTPNIHQDLTNSVIIAQPSYTEKLSTKIPMPLVADANTVIKHDINTIQAAIKNKKRTTLSLSNFLDNAKVNT